MTDESQRTEAIPEEFTPPDGLPGRREVHNRMNTALNTLRTRGVIFQPDVEMVGMQVAGVLKLLFAKGLATEAEFQYYAGLAKMEGLEGLVEMTASKSRIHLPGAN